VLEPPEPAPRDVYADTWGVVAIRPASLGSSADEPAPPPVREAVRAYVRGSVARTVLVFLAIQLLGLLVGDVVHPMNPFGTPGPGISVTVEGIFVHNLLVVMVPVLLFPLLYWAPAVSMFVTGMSVGWLMHIWSVFHLPGKVLAVGLLPHGIIEIPAFLVGATMAWRLGRASWNWQRFGGYWNERARHAIFAAAPVLGLVGIALLVAAFIEVNVTPALVRLLLG
jgi:stage II sporulation protein M